MSDLPKMSTWGTQGQKYEICDKAARERNTELGRETESIRSEVEALKQMSATAEELPSGSEPTASYSNGVLHLGIPQGPKGDTGAKGDKGDKGEKGDKGDTGPRGEQGPQGIQGIQGEQGDKGDKGDKGDTGDTGPQGPAGEAGVTPNITVTAATGEPGTDVQVEQSGTAENPVLKFTIPRGNDGYVGADGEPGKSGVYIGTDAPTDPDVNVWIDTDGEEGLLDADTLEGKHAVEFALASHMHEIEDVTGLPEAIKTAMQGRAVQNLLDNSDFRNPVNQRGATSYSGVVYGVDRWLLGYSTMAMQVNSGYITLTNSDSAWHSCLQRFPKGIITIGKTYTAAFGFADGTILSGNAVIQDGVENRVDNKSMSGVGIFLNCVNASYDFLSLSMVGGSSRNLVWAALYEGAYDASTLPAYVPKGYAAELAECMRYYYKETEQYAITPYYFSTTERYYTVMLPAKMRIAPTVTYSNVSGEYKEGWAKTNATVTVSATSISHFTMLCRGGSVTETDRPFLFMTYEASADL